MDFEREREVNKREKCKARKMHPVPEILVLKIIIIKKDSMCPNQRAGNRRALEPKGALKKRGKMETPNGTEIQGRTVYGRERRNGGPERTDGMEGGGGSET